MHWISKLPVFQKQLMTFGRPWCLFWKVLRLGGHICKTSWKDQIWYKSNGVDPETSPDHYWFGWFVFFFILMFNFFLLTTTLKVFHLATCFWKDLILKGIYLKMEYLVAEGKVTYNLKPSGLICYFVVRGLTDIGILDLWNLLACWLCLWSVLKSSLRARWKFFVRIEFDNSTLSVYISDI